jgi:hypothetical protein
LSLATALALGCGAVRLRGTTLLPPALWALAAVLAIGGVELLAAQGLVEAGLHSAVSYMAAVISLCPMMALLGAKRPQDRAWQWVVIALVATLWLPAAGALLIERGEALSLSPPWQVFLAVLVLLGPLNYLPTANWPAALVAAAGQCVLLAPYVTAVGPLAGEASVLVAQTVFLIAVGLAWLRTWRRHRDVRIRARRERELDAAWLHFRDAFGAFWAIRVLQRVNQGLAMGGSSISLAWHGWHGPPNEESEPPGQAKSSVPQADRMLRTTLRRFVAS